MLIEELAKEVHENAVAHGWWEDERETPEIAALIHSEWSEALEEARAGRPLVYRLCADCDEGPCDVEPDTATACGFDAARHKPEGIAVELIDGCIRILDYIGYLDGKVTTKDGSDSTIEILYSEENMEKVPDKPAEVIAYLHLHTSRVLMVSSPFTAPNGAAMLEALALALSWVKKQGIDPLALLLEKHEYNKTRPYKHGKMF